MTDTDSRAPAGPAVPDGAGTPLALAALLLRNIGRHGEQQRGERADAAILAEFDAPLGSGVFVVVGFLMTFTATMPLVGWIG